MKRPSKKRISDLKGVISRQRRYSTLAKQEGDYAKKMQQREYKRGLFEMAKDSKRESRIAYEFSRKRKKIVSQAVRKLQKIKKSDVKGRR